MRYELRAKADDDGELEVRVREKVDDTYVVDVTVEASGDVLPTETIHSIISSGLDSVLTPEEEAHAIANGFATPPETFGTPD